MYDVNSVWIRANIGSLSLSDRESFELMRENDWKSSLDKMYLTKDIVSLEFLNQFKSKRRSKNEFTSHKNVQLNHQQWIHLHLLNKQQHVRIYHLDYNECRHSRFFWNRLSIIIDENVRLDHILMSIQCLNSNKISYWNR